MGARDQSKKTHIYRDCWWSNRGVISLTKLLVWLLFMYHLSTNWARLMRLVQITLYFLRLGNKTKPKEPDGAHRGAWEKSIALLGRLPSQISHELMRLGLYLSVSLLCVSACAPVFQSRWQIFRLLHSLRFFVCLSHCRVSVRLNASSILLRFSRPLWIIYPRALLVIDMLADHRETDRLKKRTQR